MHLFVFAEILRQKYKVAASEFDKIYRLESLVRKDIEALYKVIAVQFPIIVACYQKIPQEPDPKKISYTDLMKKFPLAVKGHEFCREIINIIGLLYDNKDSLTLNDIRLSLYELIDLIDQNEYIEGEKAQFPQVTETIFQMFESSKGYDRRIRDESYSRARTGLKRIHSVAKTMLSNLLEIEREYPTKFVEEEKEEFGEGRLKVQRSPISVYRIKSFIRRFGNIFGIKTEDEWRKVVEYDPWLKEELTTFINALFRSKKPKNYDQVVSELKDIRERWEERASIPTGEPYLEAPSEEAAQQVLREKVLSPQQEKARKYLKELEEKEKRESKKPIPGSPKPSRSEEEELLDKYGKLNILAKNLSKKYGVK